MDLWHEVDSGLSLTCRFLPLGGARVLLKSTMELQGACWNCPASSKSHTCVEPHGTNWQSITLNQKKWNNCSISCSYDNDTQIRSKRINITKRVETLLHHLKEDCHFFLHELISPFPWHVTNTTHLECLFLLLLWPPFVNQIWPLCLEKALWIGFGPSSSRPWETQHSFHQLADLKVVRILFYKTNRAEQSRGSLDAPSLGLWKDLKALGQRVPLCVLLFAGLYVNTPRWNESSN